MDNKLKKGDYLDLLLRSPRTIFTPKDVVLMWSEGDVRKVTSRLNKYVKAGKLIRVRRGFYAKDEKYNRFELATRIYTPAYISFETVLARAGIIFQYYGNIFVASYVNREIRIGDQTITYVRLKGHVLTDTQGITHTDEVAMATPERAFLDRLFASTDYHFDNLGSLNWDNVFEMIPIYRNKRLVNKVQEYHAQYLSTL